MALFNPSRDDVRHFFFDAWRKYGANESLTALETIAVQVMQWHPEFHAVLNHPVQYLEQEYFPEMGETNPFLHLSLHLSIQEQLAIDQPAGIVAAYQKLAMQKGNHHAQHEIMECLTETIWHAQRNHAEPDSNAYINCLRQKTI